MDSPAIASPASSRRTKPLRLLLVDDNPRARHGMAALMSTHPEISIVGEASNGREAIAAVETTHPDLILMDVQMPVMDGLEATRQIKSRWPQVRVITLTIYPNYEQEARSAGADAFLVKGCSSDELLSAIIATRRIMDGQSIMVDGGAGTVTLDSK